MEKEIKNKVPKGGDLQEFADNIISLLEGDDKWEKRFKGYVGKIENRQVNIPQIHVPGLLSRYTTITADGNSIALRYKGLNVASINENLDVKINKENIENVLSISDLEEEFSWNSTDGRKFRKEFSKELVKKRNPEQTYESSLLKELERKTNPEKRYIKPVTINKKRFQMPTALSASGENVSISSKGGGIDILARRGRGSNSKLCVIEIKVDYKNIKDALYQSVAYSVFIIKLLRSEKARGSKWWKEFSINGTLPESLVINSVVAVPYTDDPANKNIMIEIGKKTYEFPETKGLSLNVYNDKINLHHLFLSDKEDLIEVLSTSLW